MNPPTYVISVQGSAIAAGSLKDCTLIADALGRMTMVGCGLRLLADGTSTANGLVAETRRVTIDTLDEPLLTPAQAKAGRAAWDAERKGNAATKAETEATP